MEVRDIEANSMPSDLYFYLPRQDQKQSASQPRPPREDARFISLATNQSKLLNVVVGSSTIYPVFPSQPLTDVCLSREDEDRQSSERVAGMHIVDGGYIHNSPIEAALRWGATHILVIEASPSDRYSEPKTFPENAGLAFNFLFEQSQRVDTVAGGAVQLFRLRPTSQCDRLQAHRHEENGKGPKQCDPYPNPNLDLFDFEQSLLAKATQVGREDVDGRVPLFERVAGPPAFRDANYMARSEGGN
jgi:predicted acylesterase/phospholipase RssA